MCVTFFVTKKLQVGRRYKACIIGGLNECNSFEKSYSLKRF